MKHKKVARLRRRKVRASNTAWDDLAESPHDLGAGPLVIPGRGRLGISHSAALTEGQVVVSHMGGRRLFSHPALTANELHKADHIEKGSRVTVSGVPTGTLTLWAIDGLNGANSRAVATLVVA